MNIRFSNMHPVLDFRFHTIYLPKPTPDVNPDKYLPKRMPGEGNPTNDAINGLIKASQDGPLSPQIVERILEGSGNGVTHIDNDNRSISTTTSTNIYNKTIQNDNRVYHNYENITKETQVAMEKIIPHNLQKKTFTESYPTQIPLTGVKESDMLPVDPKKPRVWDKVTGTYIPLKLHKKDDVAPLKHKQYAEVGINPPLSGEKVKPIGDIQPAQYTKLGLSPLYLVLNRQSLSPHRVHDQLNFRSISVLGNNWFHQRNL